MNENTAFIIAFLLVWITVMVCIGDPDILDGIIKWINGGVK